MNIRQHVSLTLLLAAAPLASAQVPGAPSTVDPVTPDATPGLPPPSPATPRNVPEPAASPDDEPAADEPVPAPAAGAGGPPGARSNELPVTPTTPRRVQNSLPAPVPVPVAPAASAARATNRYFEERAPAATSAPRPLPAPTRGRAEQIIRDTKLKVLQSHYETALSELVAAERALIDATDDKRPAMETRLKGLKGFVEKLEGEIKTLAAAPPSDAPAGMGGGGGSSRTRRGPAKIAPQPPGGAPPYPSDQTAPYSPGKATGAPDADKTTGDTNLAWCPSSPSGEEWLMLTYQRPVDLAEVRVYENYATGALARVVALHTTGDGKLLAEHVIWKDTEPKESPPCVRVIAAPSGATANGIRLEFDMSRIRSWQEIDAVELVGRDGSRQWASGAEASSYWSGGRASVWGRGTRAPDGPGSLAYVAPEEEPAAPGTVRVPASRGIIIGREGREIRLHVQDEAADPAPIPVPRGR